MTLNPYEPRESQPNTPEDEQPVDDGYELLANPTLAYTANGNLEAHSIVIWLQSNGVPAYAVEDNSGLSLFAFGTLSQ